MHDLQVPVLVQGERQLNLRFGFIPRPEGSTMRGLERMCGEELKEER